MSEILFFAILVAVLFVLSLVWKTVAKKFLFWIIAAVLASSLYYTVRTDLEFSLACEDWLALQQGYVDPDRNTVYRVLTRSPEPVVSQAQIQSPGEAGALGTRHPDIEQWLDDQEDVFSRVYGNHEAIQEAYRWSWAVEGRIEDACARQLAEPRRRVGYYNLWSKAEIRDWFRRWRDS